MPKKLTEKQREALEHLLHDPGVRYCEERQDHYMRVSAGKYKNRQE